MDILNLPKNIIQSIYSNLNYKDRPSLMLFLLSSKNDYRNIYNYFTPKRIFDAAWGYNDYSGFLEYIKSYSGKKRLEQNIEFMKIISNDLSQSINHSYKYVIWNNQKIITKKRMTKYQTSNALWKKSLQELKYGKPFLTTWEKSSSMFHSVYLHKIHSIPPGWVISAKKNAPLALSLIL
tara:strand:- start:1593 stop:2129 length:537 start_codon:yes stop_codon:yes gene_type:complete